MSLDFSVKDLFPDNPNPQRDEKCICVTNLLREMESSGRLGISDLIILAKSRYNTLCSEKITLGHAKKLYVYFITHNVSKQTSSTYVSFMLQDEDLLIWRAKM